jgi:hypothetical protein
MEYAFSQREKLVTMARRVIENELVDKAQDLPEWFTKEFLETQSIFTIIRT